MDRVTNAGKLGRSKTELETPALLIELDVLEENIRTLATFCQRHKIHWRPHTKAIKVPELAKMVVAAGAIGVTCAKLREAEIMVDAGIKDVLIANQVVGATKIGRLLDLVDRANVAIAVDSVENAREVSGAAVQSQKVVRVLVEVNIGMDRAGVEPGPSVVKLANTINRLRGLRFVGVTGYEGHCAPIKDPEEKRVACEKAVGLLIDSAEQCRRAGLPCEIVSCSGTVTSPYTAHLKGVTEVQAGGGILSDLLYESYGTHYPFALTVLSSVTSRPVDNRIVVDAGRKAMSVDMMLPRPRDLEGVESVRLSAEHGRILLRQPNASLKIGDKLEWIPGYADTTVVLHDEMVAHRKGLVEAIWPVPR